MEISEDNLKLLASHIVSNLRCECKCTLKESFNEPCACGWTHVSDWFEDECGMELKIYDDAVKKFRDNYLKEE